MTIVFPPVRRTHPNKLADVELWFNAEDGALAGLKLVGFTIWRRTERASTPDDSPEDAVGASRSYPDWTLTFPSRPWASPQGMRTFALLRAQQSGAVAMRPIWELRDLILAAYASVAERPASDFTE